MLKAVFSEGVEEITITGLTQWDKGQKLEITLADLPTNFEVHFAQYRRSEYAYVVEATSNGGVAEVSIPDIILQVASKSACAWIYIPSDDGMETIKTIVMPITERARPVDYIYEEQDILTFEKVLNRAEMATQRAEEAKAEAEQSANECKEAQGKIEGFEEYNRNNYSNSLKANASGEVVRVDDVSPAQHNVAARVRSKNIIPCPYYHYPNGNGEETRTGVTININNGVITVNGIATEDMAIHLIKGAKIPVSGKYVLSGCESGTNTTYYMQPYIDGKYQSNCTDAPVSYDWQGNLTQLSIYIKGGATLENVVICPQLEKGAVATEFTPYVDPSSVKVTRYGADETDNPETYTPNADGTLEIPSLAPTMTIYTDTEGAILEVEYNQDINVVADDINELLDLIVGGE